MSDIKMTPEEKQEKMRVNIINEIYTTEKTYNDSLHHLHKNFTSKLKTLKQTEEIKKLKENLDKLLGITDCSDKFLSALKTNILIGENNKLIIVNDTLEKTKIIAQIFIDHAKEMKEVYPLYINSYAKTIELDTQLQDKKHKRYNKKYTDFTNSFRTLTESKQLNLGSCAIMPVQRVPRYQLLVKELLKHTPNAENTKIAYATVDLALASIEDVGTVINEGTKFGNNEAIVKMAASIQKINDKRELVHRLNESEKINKEVPKIIDKLISALNNGYLLNSKKTRTNEEKQQVVNINKILLRVPRVTETSADDLVKLVADLKNMSENINSKKEEKSELVHILEKAAQKLSILTPEKVIIPSSYANAATPLGSRESSPKPLSIRKGLLPPINLLDKQQNMILGFKGKSAKAVSLQKVAEQDKNITVSSSVKPVTTRPKMPD